MSRIAPWVAWVVVIALHAVFARVLWQASRLVPPADEGALALHVVVLAAPAETRTRGAPARGPGKVRSGQANTMPMQRMPPEAAPAGAPRAHAERRDALPSDPIARPGTVRDDLAADPSGLTAVFIEQGRRLAEMQAPAGDFVRDPLQPRSAGLPAVPAERFAMRGPLSPQKAVRMIGVLFGGPGYATDPCPRIRDNIEALKTTGASDLLQEELRRDQAHCR